MNTPTLPPGWINSLTIGRGGYDFKWVIFKIISRGISCEIAIRWMPQDLTDINSLMPPGTKSLPESILTKIYCHMASVGQNDLINVRVITIETVTRKIGITEPQQLPACDQWWHLGTNVLCGITVKSLGSVFPADISRSNDIIRTLRCSIYLTRSWNGSPRASDRASLSYRQTEHWLFNTGEALSF